MPAFEPKITYVRSPIIIDINEAGQTSSQVDISIWGMYDTEPTHPQYTLSKNIASATQTLTSYNIANYIKEFINPISPTPTSIADLEYDNIACYFRVKRSYLIGTAIYAIDDTLYIGVNGYSYYENGRNRQTNLPAVLCNKNITINNLEFTFNYINFITDRVDYEHQVIYTDVHNTSIQYFTPTTQGSIWRIPTYCNDLPTATNMEILYNVEADESFNIPLLTIEECKYEPQLVNFINQSGGWQPLIFFKNSSTSASLKGTDYKLAQDNYNYNEKVAQYQSININGKRTHKLNTGWVDENYSELIENLMASETILLNDKPVNCKTQSMEYKTILKDKMINYTITFEDAFNLLNDMV